MTATQAPTPGPLSVGDRVVAVADLRKHPDGPVWVQRGEEVGIVREYGIDNCIAGVALQDGREGDWAKSCFRLAPTAPVEASGSEREHGPKCWGKTSVSDEMLYCYCGSTGLRPQPSGETIEQRFPALNDHLIRMASSGNTGSLAEWGEFLECLRAALDIPHAKDRIVNEGLIDIVEGIGSIEHGTWRDAKGVRLKDTPAWARFYVASRSTIPARAEPQDEGAAGEPVAYPAWLDVDGVANLFARIIDPEVFGEANNLLSREFEAMGYGDRDQRRNRALSTARKLIDCYPLYAHPSPTPAADDDRVRIMREGWAAEMFDAGHTVCEDRWTDRHVTEERRDRYRRAVDRKVNEALAALKSTAAKEGGAA